MTLTEFLNLPDASIGRLATLADISRQSMTAIAKGTSCPSVATAKAISDATGGLVSLDEIAEPFVGKGRRAS